MTARHTIAAAFTALFFAVMTHAVVYQEAGAFVAEAFTGNPPAPKTLWLDTAMQAEIVKILGHRYPVMRLRYWSEGHRSAWILEEIGKEEPITVGIVIERNRIELV